MAGPDDPRLPDGGADRLRSALAALGEPSVVVRTPADVMRRSFVDLAMQQETGRQVRSTGRFRLHGAGVEHNTARLETVGAFSTGIQRLVSAVGGALRDSKNLRGTLPQSIQNLTRLRLATAPLPGSVMLQVEPETLPEDELTPDGQPQFDLDRQPQLADEAVEELVRVLLAATKLGPDEDESEFLEEVRTLGPRVAAALRDLAGTLSSSDLDVDIEWMEPRRTTQRVRVLKSDSDRIIRIVQSRKLDAEQVTIEGILHTKSDVSSLHIETEPESWVSVKRGALTAEAQRGIELGDRVRVQAEMIVNRQPAGGESISYSAQSIERIE